MKLTEKQKSIYRIRNKERMKRLYDSRVKELKCVICAKPVTNVVISYYEEGKCVYQHGRVLTECFKHARRKEK